MASPAFLERNRKAEATMIRVYDGPLRPGLLSVDNSIVRPLTSSEQDAAIQKLRFMRDKARSMQLIIGRFLVTDAKQGRELELRWRALGSERRREFMELTLQDAASVEPLKSAWLFVPEVRLARARGGGRKCVPRVGAIMLRAGGEWAGDEVDRKRQVRSNHRDAGVSARCYLVGEAGALDAVRWHVAHLSSLRRGAKSKLQRVQIETHLVERHLVLLIFVMKTWARGSGEVTSITDYRRRAKELNWDIQLDKDSIAHCAFCLRSEIAMRTSEKMLLCSGCKAGAVPRVVKYSSRCGSLELSRNAVYSR